MNIKNFVQAFKKLDKTKLIFATILVIFISSLAFILPNLKKEEEGNKVKGASDGTAYAVSLLKACYKNPDRTKCLKDAAKNIYENLTLDEYQTAIKTNETDEAVFNTCHETSHYVGRLAYQKVGDIKKLFNQCQHICLDGCFHGVVEGYFINRDIILSEDNFPKIASEVGNLCGQEKDYEVPELYRSCLHGLGHAVMYITDFELPQALELCDGLSNYDEEELCYTGVFMANSDSRNSVDHPTKYLKADDPMYPCNILPEKHQKKCYEYNTLTFYLYTDFDWEKTIELCGQVPEDYRRGCYETMGGDQVGFTDNVEKIKDECSVISEFGYRSACFKGAEANLVMRYSEDFIKPIEFCQIMDSVYKKGCYETFILLLNSFSRDVDKKRSVCKSVSEEKFQNECLEGVN